MKTPFSLIVAIDSKNGIGKNGQLPWHLPADLKHFREITCTVRDPKKQNVVLMGRKTWDSIPEKFRPLPGRINVVLSRRPDLELPQSVVPAGSFETAFNILESKDLKSKWESVFVIGGAEIFSKAIKFPECRKLFMTHIESSFFCDTCFPEFQKAFRRIRQDPWQTENDLRFYFAEYIRP